MSRNIVIRENILCLFILGSIGSIFILKYFSRYIDFAEIIAIIYLPLFVTIFIFLSQKISYELEFLNKKLFIVFFIIIVLASIFAISYLPEKSRVARLPAITSWIEYLFRGQFPWGSPAEPSGFPFLFILAIPFYLIGNIGYIEVLGLILYGFILLRYPGSTNKEIWTRLFILMCLPTFYYEFIVRSELFFNISLVIAFILFVGERISPQKRNVLFFAAAFILGLILSTRSIVAVVFTIYLIFLFRENLLNGIIFLAITFLAFTFTLVPFIVWNSASFYYNGPFIIQLTHFPLWGTIIFFFISIIFGWKAKNIHQVIMFSGVLIFTIVATGFILIVVKEGFYNAIVKDGFDISYFILCIPFLVLSVRN
jgi:hypothetical protein